MGMQTTDVDRRLGLKKGDDATGALGAKGDRRYGHHSQPVELDTNQ
jgi:hypothetical protein